jgi:hypothetical protein
MRLRLNRRLEPSIAELNRHTSWGKFHSHSTEFLMPHLASIHAHTSIEATRARIAGVGVLALSALGYFYGYWFSHGLA